MSCRCALHQVLPLDGCYSPCLEHRPGVCVTSNVGPYDILYPSRGGLLAALECAPDFSVAMRPAGQRSLAAQTQRAPVSTVSYTQARAGMLGVL